MTSTAPGTEQRFEQLSAIWSRRDPNSVASDAVYAAIREGILSGVLSPGTRLAEEEYARRLSVSRTPVREAILRLESEGLAARAPRRGLVVASITEDEILELYVVRAAVDGLAARLAAQASVESDIAALRWINESMVEAMADEDWAGMARLNLEFHETLARSGRNSVLLEIVLSIHDRVRRFPGTTLSVRPRASQATAEHGLIVEAVAAGNLDAAEALARHHMEEAMKVRMLMLRRAGSG